MAAPLDRLLALRQHERDGRRSPHKPLLTLLALGRLVQTGRSDLPWTEAEIRLGDLLAEFGPSSTTSRTQSAAYPFTRLRSDGVWVLDHNVPMDLVTPLRESATTGRFAPDVERVLSADPGQALATARALVTSHFPESLYDDVLVAVGLDPAAVLGGLAEAQVLPDMRRRSTVWRQLIVDAWDRQCAFCGYDGQLAGAVVGLEAAHIRWFNHDGPDEPDNGLALCSLHHALFDRGALGLTLDLRVQVSARFTARTDAGKSTYALHGRVLTPRPGTSPPHPAHVGWHLAQVFRGDPLAA